MWHANREAVMFGLLFGTLAVCGLLGLLLNALGSAKQTSLERAVIWLCVMWRRLRNKRERDEHETSGHSA